MVLLDELVEIFRLADLDEHFAISIDGFKRGEIGAALEAIHSLGHAIPADRFLEVSPGRALVPMGA